MQHTYFKELNLANGKLSLRSLKTDDIEDIVNYWVNGDREIFKQMGIDIEKFPDKESRIDFFTKLINTNPQKGESCVIVGLLNNEIFGYALFNHIQPSHNCQGHLHIINPNLRRCGITSLLFARFLYSIMNFLNVNSIYCEPSADNLGINKFLQNSFLKPSKTFIKEAQGICKKMEVNQYKITKTSAFFLRLYASYLLNKKNNQSVNVYKLSRL